MYPAILWRPQTENAVQCRVCSHFCLIPEGESGKCTVRVNRGGKLFSLVYDTIAAANLDPVEKKPLYHFLPSTSTFSVGTMGCNFTCSFCQNYSLSMPPESGVSVRGMQVTPEDIVNEALRSGAKSISYTYNEPTVFLELMRDTAELARKHGLRNIMVSNGYQSAETLALLKEHIDAANIDLKAFSDQFYSTMCGGHLRPVLKALIAAKEMGWWLEVTTLLIPDANDSEEELKQLAEFIHNELGADVPWHISRFHPTHKLTDRSQTSIGALEAALKTGADAGLKYVYAGNVAGHTSESTHCSVCGDLVIRRTGFAATGALNGVCPECGDMVAGIWE